MQFFILLAKLIPFIFALVKAAEVIIDKKGAGEEKKAAVKIGVTAIFDGIKEVSAGGQKETFEKVEPLFDAVLDKGIDLAASMIPKNDS